MEEAQEAPLKKRDEAIAGWLTRTGAGRPSPRSLHRLGQEGKQRALLLHTGGSHAQQALHKATTRITPRAETAFAPEHGMPKRSFRSVVGRLYTLHPTEGEERLSIRDQFATEAGNLRIGTVHSFSQSLGQCQTHRNECLLQGNLVNPALLVQMPGYKQVVAQVKQVLRLAALLTVAPVEAEEIPQQMGPTQLPPLIGIVLIHAPAV